MPLGRTVSEIKHVLANKLTRISSMQKPSRKASKTHEYSITYHYFDLKEKIYKFKTSEQLNEILITKTNNNINLTLMFLSTLMAMENYVY